MAFHQAVHDLLREVSQKAILPYYQKLAEHQVERVAPYPHRERDLLRRLGPQPERYIIQRKLGLIQLILL